MTVASVACIGLLVLIGLIAFGVFLLLILYLIQDRLIYMTIPCESRYPHENSEEKRSPASQGMDYEDIRLITPDGTQLHGWFIKSNNPSESRTIIFYHENAENIGYRVPFFKEYINFTQSNIVIVAYRGYSYSKGKPSESGLKQDALTILKYVTQQLAGIDRSKVYLHGKSLGGAVTTYTANHAAVNQICGVILQNTFTTLADVVQSVMRKLCLGLCACIRHKVLTSYWRSIDIIDRIRVPVLFIKSKNDKLIPTAQMDQLQEKLEQAGGVCREFGIEEGNHDDTWIINKPKYFRAVSSFFQMCEEQVG